MRDMEYIGQMKELKRAQFHLTRCARQLEQARERDTPTRPVVIAGIGSALIGISYLDEVLEGLRHASVRHNHRARDCQELATNHVMIPEQIRQVTESVPV